MSDKSRSEEISLELVALRQQLYNSIADDALSLLNIQLLSLPITLSLISLLLTLFLGNTGEEQQIGDQISNSADIQLIMTGLLILSGSILWSVFVYHYSKRYAHQAPNQFIDTLQEENSRDRNYYDSEHPMAVLFEYTNQKLRPAQNIAEKGKLEVDSQRGGYQRFDEVASKERFLRHSSVFAIVSTVIGILLVVIGLTKSVIPYADYLGIQILLYVVIFLPIIAALVYVIDTLTLVGSPIRFLYEFLSGIIEILFTVFQSKYEIEIENDFIGTSIATVAAFAICVCGFIWTIWEIESLKFITSYLSVVAISKTL